jgi:outer membrane protein assembly factor BamB
MSRRNVSRAVVITVTLLTVIGSTMGVAVPIGATDAGVNSAGASATNAASDVTLTATVDTSAAGYRPNETGPTDGPNVSAVWNATLPSAAGTPALGDDLAFVATGSRVVGIDRTTGEVGFSFEPGFDVAGLNDPVVADGTVYVVAAADAGGSNPQYLLGVDVANGSLRWDQRLGGRGKTAPTVANGTVYVADRSPLLGTNSLYAYDADTGDPLWNSSFRDQPIRAVTVHDGTVYLGDDAGSLGKGRVFAVDAATGTETWRNRSDGPVNDLAVADGRVYAAEGDRAAAYDATDGTVAWTNGTAGRYDRVTAGDERVYVARRFSNGLSALNSDTGTPVWRTETESGGSASVSGELVVTADTLYTGTGTGRILALDTATGDRRWTRLSDAGVAGPALDGGTLFVGGGRTVRAYDDAGTRLPDPDEDAGLTGVRPDAVGPDEGQSVSREWTRSFAANVTSPATAGGRAYVTTGGRLVAVDRATGNVTWTFAPNLTRPALREPVVRGSTVYVLAREDTGGADPRYVVAVDDSGTRQWREGVGLRGKTVPTVTDEAVYVADRSPLLGTNSLYAYDADTGDPRWRFDVDDSPVRAPPAVLNGTAYVASADGDLYAINTDSGGGLWRTPTAGTPNRLAAADGTVFAAQSDRVTAFDAAEGSERWNRTTGNDTRSVAVDGGRIYVGVAGSDGVTALDVADGSRLWQIPAPGVTGPTVTEAGVFVGDDDGTVRLVNATTGSVEWSRSVDGPADAAVPVGPRLLVANGSGLVSFVETGEPPTVSVSVSVDNPDRGESVTFTAEATDPDGTVQSYAWDLDGDGAVDAQGETVSTSYAANDTYEVTVAVADDDGFTARRTVEVTVGPTNPFPNGVPGVSGGMPPRNVDPGTDRAFEDVNGDGTFGFIDVVDLLFALTDIQDAPLSDAQLAAVDFDGDGSVGFLDVVTLLFEL